VDQERHQELKSVTAAMDHLTGGVVPRNVRVNAWCLPDLALRQSFLLCSASRAVSSKGSKSSA
jgi:hypothetical protein